MNRVRIVLLLLIGLTALASLSIADVPGRINYQGQLTDTSGDPVADGTYKIGFTLFNDSLAGDWFWSETHTGVSVTNGLFNVMLGATSPVPSSIIDTADVFLEIQVGAEVMQPRTRFVSVPYALAAYKAISLNHESFVDEAGDTLRGELFFHGGTGSGGRLNIGNDYTNIDLEDNGSLKTRIYGKLYGEMGMWNPNDVLSINLRAPSSGGVLDIYDATGTSSITMHGGPAIDNNSLVQLPAGSVDDVELMNEPGIASNAVASAVSVGRGEFTDIQTVTIVIPAPGYIYLSGSCYIKTYNDTSMISGAYVQIDETEGGTVASSHGVRYSFPSNDYFGEWRHSVSVQRTYYKAAAGTYEFRLEAKKYVPSAGNPEAYNGQLTAIYLPTSYESVKTLVADPGDNPEAIPVVMRDEDGNPTGETQYQVDLRYYELKAKQARIEALEAERELQIARDRAARK